MASECIFGFRNGDIPFVKDQRMKLPQNFSATGNAVMSLAVLRLQCSLMVPV